MSNNILKRLNLFFVILSGLLAESKTKSIFNLVASSQESFSFLCQDQMVKVNSNIYHLDRLRSSLKSNYFEKLFASGEFKQMNDEVLEIQPKHGELFPIVVDLINGKKLIDVLNKDNYLRLLEAMDYLEMEIDLNTVNSFINEKLKLHSAKDANIFESYKFIRKNRKFAYLLDGVLNYFSDNLTAVHNREMLSSLVLNHLIRIIQSVKNMTDEKRWEIIKTCIDWLYQDLENRLPRLVILVNSIKPVFHTKDTNNDTLTKCVLRTNVGKRAYKKGMASCLFALLAYGGKLNPTILRRGDLSASYFRLPNWDTYENEVQERREEYDEYEQNESSPSFLNYIDVYNKLRKFLKNGDFYDITVRVGKKAYKLHRFVLESRCGYFAEIFRAEYAEAVAKCDGLPTCPSRDEEYALDSVDQSTFDAVIRHIYFDEDIARENNGIGRIFKTADFLKIDSLLEILQFSLKKSDEEIGSQDLVEVLNSVRGKMHYDDLYLTCLCKHISTKWPNIDNVSQFCSVSWPMFEKMLKSPHFRLDDPRKILDICSTWVVHDVKNRYCFLPRIAQTINLHCVINQDEFMAKMPADSTLRSEQFIRDKLWEILSTLSYTATLEALPNSRPTKLEEIPVFVVSSEEKSIEILNGDLDEIASFSLSPNTSDSLYYGGVHSATMMNDNLFILLKHSYSFSFLVYNFSLKKCFQLTFNTAAKFDYFWKSKPSYTLLCCNNEIYCCSDSGEVMKFSIQLNRWVILSKHKVNKDYLMFTSDGRKLYRMYQVSEKGSYNNYVVEPYDFEKNVWSCESSLPMIENIIAPPQHLNVVKDHIAVSTFARIVLFDRKSKKWQACRIPTELGEGAYRNIFAHSGDEMLLVAKNNLYNISLSNGNYKLKKNVSSKYKLCDIKVIHRL